MMMTCGVSFLASLANRVGLRTSTQGTPLLLARHHPQLLVITHQQKQQGVTAWEAIRDILVTSLNKGQFPLAVIALVVLMVLWRMPSADVSKLAFDVLADLRNGYLVGYAIGVMAVGGWFWHAKYLRRAAANEVQRIATERTRAQEKQAGSPLKSSKK